MTVNSHQKNDMESAVQVESAKMKIIELLDEILMHDGFGEMKVEVKILKRKQKEIIIHCGKQYRFVVDPLM